MTPTRTHELIGRVHAASDLAVCSARSATRPTPSWPASRAHSPRPTPPCTNRSGPGAAIPATARPPRWLRVADHKEHSAWQPTNVVWSWRRGAKLLHEVGNAAVLVFRRKSATGHLPKSGEAVDHVELARPDLRCSGGILANVTKASLDPVRSPSGATRYPQPTPVGAAASASATRSLVRRAVLDDVHDRTPRGPRDNGSRAFAVRTGPRQAIVGWRGSIVRGAFCSITVVSLQNLPNTLTKGTARQRGVHPCVLFQWRNDGEITELSRDRVLRVRGCHA